MQADMTFLATAGEYESLAREIETLPPSLQKQEALAALFKLVFVCGEAAGIEKADKLVRETRSVLPRGIT